MWVYSASHMEDTQNQETVTQTPPQSSGFSVQPHNQNNGGLKWILIFVGLLILGGAGIFFFTKSSNKIEATPTPAFGVVPIEETETPIPVATSSAAPVKKEDISIEIQNGTGISGEAKLLQDKLKALGYTDIKVGNADSTDNTETTVTFLKTTSQTVQDELKKVLEGMYKTVNVKTSTTQTVDVIIITGLRGTQTTKAVSSTTPKASAKASATASAKPSPTPTP